MFHPHVSTITLFLALQCICACAAAHTLSTTHDGNLQAIAQGPTSIALYWKSQEKVPPIYADGVLCEAGECIVDPASGFARRTFDSLAPNSEHTFMLGQNGPTVSERTWCAIPECAAFDVLVIGATASGTAAAVTAARLGLNVALVEETNRIGGMASNGLGSTDIRSISTSNGFFDDFRRRVVEFYGEGDGLRYEPRVANAIFKDMVYQQPRISVFLGTEALKPLMDGNRVVGAVVRSLDCGDAGQIMARVTIDATYTADFAAQCGCEVRIGREPRTQNEPHAGVIYFDDVKQEILPGSTGAGDCKQQSYAYLMTWKDYGERGAALVQKPRYYDPQVYAHSPIWAKTWNFTSGKLREDKYEINQHPFGIDWPGINHAYPIADRERRRAVEALYRDRALGYLYYFQNELGHKNLGLADDEYLDSDNFPPQLYVREARRVVGEYVMQESDVTCARQYHRADAIGIGDYPMDSHAMEDLKDPTRIDKGEGEGWFRKATPWFQTPMGVIVPKHVEGLLVSTAVSSTHIGYGTLRMEPVRFAMGQAAGAAAYWSVLYGEEPRTINPAWVQDKLLSQYAYINWNSDVNRDTRHFKAINFLTARGMFEGEAFEPGRNLTRQEAIDALNELLDLERCVLCLEPPDLPDEAVTSGQFAQWLVEAKRRSADKWKITRPAQPSYTDVSPDSPHFLAVETLHAHRIRASLFDNPKAGVFQPNAPISRADAAEAIFLAHRAYAMNYWLVW